MHKMDPRFKIMLTLIYMVFAFMSASWRGYGIVAAFLLVAMISSGVPIKVILRSLKPLLFILLFTFILNLIFTTTGTPLFSWWIIKVTDKGVVTAIQMAMRLTFLVLGTSMLTLTTSPIALTDGIEALLSPFKRLGFPAHEMAMMMSIALRFIPTLMDEADKITKAQMARGADFESGNLLQRAKSMIPLLVPLFISAFRRADELAMAMEARCYHGGEGRTRMNVLKSSKIDYIGCVFMALLGVCIVLWGGK